MQRQENFLPYFIVFFGLSIILILVGRIGVLDSLSSLINKSTNPVRSATIDIFSLEGFQNKQIKDLITENNYLKKVNSDRENLILENKALKDQFSNSANTSRDQIPAKVIGYPGFIPGSSIPEFLIIDKGKNQNVNIEDSVIVGNYLVGKVIKANGDSSRVELLNNKNSSFTAIVDQTDGREIAGIIIGKGGVEMNFENVLLTHTLKKDMTIATKGEKDEEGRGYPPDLIVGKIVSIERSSSDLFQKAKVVSPIDFTSLHVVFVIN